MDLFAKELQSLISPYYGLSMKHVNIGKILMSSSSLAAQHGLSLPTELMLYFKSIVSFEGLGQKVAADFDFLTYALSMVGELAQHQFQPAKFVDEAQILLRESRGFLNSLPRQLNLILRRMNSPDYKTRLHIEGVDELKRSIEISFNLLFLGIIIAALIIASSMVYPHPSEWVVGGMPGISLLGYVISGALGIVAFFNYIKKS